MIFVFDFLHWIWWSLGPPMSWQMELFHSFYGWVIFHYICMYTIHYIYGWVIFHCVYVNVYIYIQAYMYIYTCVCVHVCVYVWDIISHQSEWPSSKGLHIINSGEAVEKREPFYTIDVDVNQYSHYGEWCEGPLKN